MRLFMRNLNATMMDGSTILEKVGEALTDMARESLANCVKKANQDGKYTSVCRKSM